MKTFTWHHDHFNAHTPISLKLGIFMGYSLNSITIHANDLNPNEMNIVSIAIISNNLDAHAKGFSQRTSERTVRTIQARII